MGAGAGAQKITTDVTGNDTAGMVVGMVASGMTAKGLNGIEAEANKLAQSPKGLYGATEGVGNVAEDVGKAGKGLEGASSAVAAMGRWKALPFPDLSSTPVWAGITSPAL